MKPDEKEAENIRVAVRCRPMNDREIREQAVSCFRAENGNAVLTNLENPTEKHEFGYDFVYGCDSAQESVFQDIGVPILDRAFGGYNGTIFAYGQTGSGKTFSMSGVSGSEALEGLIPRMNKSIFDRITVEKQSDPNKLFLVECSFFEIYNEIIYDLLDASGNGKKNKGGLEIKEHSVLGIYVKDLQERVVDSRDEVIDLMAQGAQARTVGYTQMNAESSRSHSIFVIKIHQKDATDESKNIFAKINLVDLAGSERAASTGAQGDRLKEGANINKSLSALGNVINALVEASRMGKKVFIPYRNSKLTRVLQESLGGNSLCSMLATLSPANINFPETLSTLKYASRAKSIKVNAKKNESSSQISQLNEEIAALKKKLTEQTEVTLGLDPKEKDEIVKAYEKQIQEMDRVRLQTWEDKAKLSKQHELERKRLAKEKAIADQKIRDERTRKWKLLEDKGDIELMLRALRDLDRSPSGAVGATGCSSTEERWLERAAKIRALESESKDHRTLILVFKDALHKDVEAWGKRTKHDATKRDDSAASFHMTASQLCNKLQNIDQETAQLLALEHQLVGESNTLINDISSELLRFKEHRVKRKATAGNKPSSGAVQTPTAGGSSRPTANAAKEVEQVLEEREKGLLITLSMVQMQRARVVAFIKSERKRVFDFADVAAQFMHHIDEHLASAAAASTPSTSADATVVSSSSERRNGNASLWAAMKTKMIEITAKWRAYWDVDAAGSTTDSVDTSADFVAKGDVAPLGMESKLIYDESLVVSSKKLDAKLARMGSPQLWVPDEQDQAPSLLIDLELPRVFHSLQIRGGCFNGTAATPHPSSSGMDATEITGSKAGVDAVARTFVLKPPASLANELSKFRAGAITGEHEQTYEILSNVMSWIDLLKTSIVPAKLFARPPVRFLHDVISIVIQNTGFAAELFSANEKDYAQLSSKTERADYLTKIIDAVQETYRVRTPGDSSVVIAATASNILAGKEPTDTLQFLSYFALAAIEHAIEHRPVTPLAATTTLDSSSSSSSSGNAGGNVAATVATPRTTAPTDVVSDSAQVQADTSAAPASVTKALRECWVTKIRVTTSVDGKDWHLLGDFDANVDSESVHTILLDSGQQQSQQLPHRTQLGLVGRYIKLSCVTWHDLPLFQVEVLGQEAIESDALVKSLELLGATAIALLQQLREAAALLLDEAKVSWDKAKDVEREKQEELASVSEELVAVKKTCSAFEAQTRELTQALAQLQIRFDDDAKKLSDERVRSDKLQKELTQATIALDDVKKKHEVLATKSGEQSHALQTLTLQQSEQKKMLLTLEQSKRDLEQLSSSLQAQLQNRDQQDGHQESKIASMYGELMSANVQLEEFKRKLETSEQMRQEQEAFGAQMHAELQQNRVAMSEKEQAIDESVRQKQKAFDDAFEVLRVENAQLQTALEHAGTNEARLKTSNSEAAAQLKTQQDAIDALTKKLRDTEATVSAATTTAAASAAAASAEAGEKMLLEAQTKELRCLAEIEKMETKAHALELKLKESETKALELEQDRQTLLQRIAALEEAEEEMQLQLQVVTEERDSARQKEEQLFAENNEKEQEIERIRDGYVWVTDRMNTKEDELSELQEQIEKYQTLLEITSVSGGGSKTKTTAQDTEANTANLQKLYALAFGESKGKTKLEKSSVLMQELERWIEQTRKSSTADAALPKLALQTSAASKSTHASDSSATTATPATALTVANTSATSSNANASQPRSDSTQGTLASTSITSAATTTSDPFVTKHASTPEPSIAKPSGSAQTPPTSSAPAPAPSATTAALASSSAVADSATAAVTLPSAATTVTPVSARAVPSPPTSNGMAPVTSSSTPAAPSAAASKQSTSRPAAPHAALNTSTPRSSVKDVTSAAAVQSAQSERMAPSHPVAAAVASTTASATTKDDDNEYDDDFS